MHASLRHGVRSPTCCTRADVSPSYLDHAATTAMPDAVVAVYAEALKVLGNPASTHRHGQEASAVLEDARERIAWHLGADAAEVILTGGGTESINLALKGLWWARQRDTARPVILLAEGEHHATIEAAEWLRDSQGAELVWIPIDADAMLQPEVLERCIADSGAERIALISFLWANNEVGTVQPVAELCAVAERFDIPVHVDAVAALGQVPISAHAVGAQALSVSAHKVGGPPGVGALVLERRSSAEALLHGGSQQRSRAGTQNVAGAVGFAAALDWVLRDGADERIERLAALRNRLVEGVGSAVPDAVLRGSPVGPTRLAGNAHFTFPDCQGDSLVFVLDSMGVSASVGSACQAGVQEVSHVLLAMGIAEPVAAGSLRLTLGAESSDDDIDALLEALPIAVARAKRAGLS